MTRPGDQVRWLLKPLAAFAKTALPALEKAQHDPELGLPSPGHVQALDQAIDALRTLVLSAEVLCGPTTTDSNQ